MSAKEYRKQLREIKGRLCRDASIDNVTYDAYCWWMNKELTEMEQEMKKNRPARRSSLRARLKVLLVSILAQAPVGVKEVRQDARECLSGNGLGTD